jgi:hypothetical protein
MTNTPTLILISPAFPALGIAIIFFLLKESKLASKPEAKT